jgi:DNA-directed RNA polymerase subunit M/transcription elongation factor TFIIS
MPPKITKGKKESSASAASGTTADSISSGSKEIVCLILQQKGTFKQSYISENSCEAIGKIFRRAQNPELIGKWEKSDMHLLLYGYKKGKDGTENKHEIPPPYGDVKLFSDIALVAIGIDGKLKNVNHDFWSRFVASIMGEDSDAGSDSEYDSENEEELSDIEEEKEESDDSSSDGSGFQDDDVIDEDGVEEIVVKKKSRVVKKPSKRLPLYYSIEQLSPESIDSPYVIPTNKTRLQCLKIIEKKLDFLKNEDQQRLEQGIYNATVQTCKSRHIWTCYENPEFSNMYMIICRKTITNLDPDSYVGNTGLYDRLKSGSYTSTDIASLGAYEMYPEKWRSLIDIQLKRDKHLLEGGTDLEYATDMFKCSRCGKRKCTYYEMQTRSADEAMTVFIKCLICKKEWKQ